ncbi:MAG: aminoglycoside phosphotransferase family protein [Fimbriimonadaceae bacterium]|nr:aminoglycoside phosphotransferase family protein [Fimbriimonadaceae bacterium]
MHPPKAVERFLLGSVRSAQPFADRGNINPECWLVESDQGKFLVQRINTSVFRDPARVMTGASAWLGAQERLMHQGGLPPGWRGFSFATTVEGSNLVEDETGFWRAMSLIEGVRSYKRLSDVGDRARQLAIARQVGRGLAAAAAIGSRVRLDRGSLPGFHDTEGYYRQLEAVLRGCTQASQCADLLPGDPQLLQATQHLYLVRHGSLFAERLADIKPMVEALLRAKPEAMALREMGWEATAVHGDTKLENFLFNPEDRVVALVDLDTVMPGPWELDWADAVRSLVNPAGEIVGELDTVRYDGEVEQAMREGFLGARSHLAGPDTSARMCRAALAVTLEQALRFATDYLRGDVYYHVPAETPDLNKNRAEVQMRLADQMRDAYAASLSSSGP